MIRRWLVEMGGAAAQSKWEDDEAMARWHEDNAELLNENVEGVTRARETDVIAAKGKTDPEFAKLLVAKLLRSMSEADRASVHPALQPAQGGAE